MQAFQRRRRGQGQAGSYAVGILLKNRKCLNLRDGKEKRRRAGPEGNVSARSSESPVLHGIARATPVAASSVAFADRLAVARAIGSQGHGAGNKRVVPENRCWV